MLNVTLCNLIWVLVFGIITIEVTGVKSQLLSPDTDTVKGNSDFNVTSQIPEDSVTKILSLTSSTPEEEEEEDDQNDDYPEEEEDQNDDYPEEEEDQNDDYHEEEEDQNDSTQPPEITTTLGSSNSSTLSPEITTSNSRDAHCPFLGVRQVPGTLVQYQCKENEVLVDDDQCQHYPKGTVIPAQTDHIETQEVPVTNYKVIVRDVECDPGKGRLLNFTKEQFYLRPRGDLVLLESSGDLYGQRINNYSIMHQLDEHGDLTLKAKVCVPVPAVPRCCPPGQAMKDGSCQPANTPDILMPPIRTASRRNSVEWPNITNYLSPLTCTNDPVKMIPLSDNESYLSSFALGVEIVWLPGVIDGERRYFSCPDYCVDGIENSDGSVNYFASFCYSNPKERHEDICAGGPCLRKCCESGEVMDVNYFDCVSAPNSIFNPPTVKNVSNYNIVIGKPLCTPYTKADGAISIDESGNLIYDGREFPSSDYCVDTFVNKSAREQNVLVCVEFYNLWYEVRPILFPVCNYISIFFLIITIACHLMVPKLQKNGGVYLLCHSIALTIAYIASVIVNVLHDHLGGKSCFPIAVLMQFGFLSTFFWLNVMCFGVWRKIRQLKMCQPCKSSPIGYYELYAWGIPFVICLITAGMQFWAPKCVPDVIKPHIGYTKCWFKDDIPLLIYFYGPIAFLLVCNTVFLGFTYYNYKHMMRSFKETPKCLREVGAGVITSPLDSTSSIASRQLFTDHVHDCKQQLQIFLLMTICWVTEVLSWKIPPPEIWALTDTLNSLMGVFIFIILMFNSKKRKEIEKKFKCMQTSNDSKRLL